MSEDQGARVSGHSISVDLGTRSYDIHIGTGLLGRAGEYLQSVLNRPFSVIVTDDTVAPLHLDTLCDSLKAAGITTGTIILPAGEATKSFHHLESLVGGLLDLNVERSDCVCALGGGVIGDLTGFATAILRRGVDFVQIPTTLLAQVDSSVGGKTGINTSQGKNLVGAFHQPRLVLSDISLLDTLPLRDVLAGYAEILKTALIADPAFFDWLENFGPALKNGDNEKRVHAVTRAAQAKVAIVMQDEREQGARALLNLGHTFGHALEATTGFGEDLRHGEAVAIGLALAFGLSHEMGLCSTEDVSRVITHLQHMGLPSGLHDLGRKDITADILISHMAQDKKVVNGQATFILTRGIGQAFINRDVPQGILHDFLTKMTAA